MPFVGKAGSAKARHGLKSLQEPTFACPPPAFDDDFEAQTPACRICFEESKDCAQFISPCKCIGTQKYVHFKCLRRWQQNVITMNDATDVRAHRCGVCCATYSTPPPTGNAGLRMVNALRGVGSAVCISLLAFGLSGPPWPHLALLVLLLLGTRSHSLLALALLLVGSLVATLHARGLRVVMRVDGHGRAGLALIRHGAPVEGLQQGSLLVASESLDRGVFRRSVVLLTEHSPQGGSRGVILTQPLSYAEALGMQMPAPALSDVSIRHQLGGPVGMPSGASRPASELAVLHTVPGVGGARRLLPATPAPRPGGRHSTQHAPSELYYGGSVTEVAERVMSGGTARGRPRHRLWVFHGICAWAPGQLEGEVRGGSWGFADGSTEDLTAVPAEHLWWRLIHDAHRLNWGSGSGQS